MISLKFSASEKSPEPIIKPTDTIKHNLIFFQYDRYQLLVKTVQSIGVAQSTALGSPAFKFIGP